MKLATDTVYSSEGNIAARTHKQRGEEQLLSSSIMLNSHQSNRLAELSPSSLELGTLVCFRPCSAGKTLPHSAPVPLTSSTCSYLCPPPSASVVAGTVAVAQEGKLEGPSGLLGAAGWVLGACVMVAGLLTWLNRDKSGGLIIITPGDSRVECASAESYPQASSLSSNNCDNGDGMGDCSTSKAGSLGSGTQNLSRFLQCQECIHNCPIPPEGPDWHRLYCRRNQNGIRGAALPAKQASE